MREGARDRLRAGRDGRVEGVVDGGQQVRLARPDRPDEVDAAAQAGLAGGPEAEPPRPPVAHARQADERRARAGAPRPGWPSGARTPRSAPRRSVPAGRGPPSRTPAAWRRGEGRVHGRGSRGGCSSGSRRVASRAAASSSAPPATAHGPRRSPSTATPRTAPTTGSMLEITPARAASTRCTPHVNSTNVTAVHTTPRNSDAQRRRGAERGRRTLAHERERQSSRPPTANCAATAASVPMRRASAPRDERPHDRADHAGRAQRVAGERPPRAGAADEQHARRRAETAMAVQAAARPARRRRGPRRRRAAAARRRRAGPRSTPSCGRGPRSRARTDVPARPGARQRRRAPASRRPISPRRPLRARCARHGTSGSRTTLGQREARHDEPRRPDDAPAATLPSGNVVPQSVPAAKSAAKARRRRSVGWDAVAGHSASPYRSTGSPTESRVVGLEARSRGRSARRRRRRCRARRTPRRGVRPRRSRASARTARAASAARPRPRYSGRSAKPRSAPSWPSRRSRPHSPAGAPSRTRSTCRPTPCSAQHRAAARRGRTRGRLQRGHAAVADPAQPAGVREQAQDERRRRPRQVAEDGASVVREPRVGSGVTARAGARRGPRRCATRRG